MKEGDHGHYDFFYNRILFPIRTSAGKPVGYTARHKNIKPPKGSPKYINSPDSIVFDKSKFLYGLYENQISIVERQFAYLVEGPTDVILMDQHGIGNVVAALGTAFTEHHAKKLAQITDHVILLMDGDTAGVKAAKKAMAMLYEARVTPLYGLKIISFNVFIFLINSTLEDTGGMFPSTRALSTSTLQPSPKSM